MSYRLQQLERSLQLYQFMHSVEEELNWIREREHKTGSTELGSNLTSVQTLLGKHQVYIHSFVLHTLTVD